MSIAHMWAVWRLELPALEKLVLLAYADHARISTGIAWPKAETVARKCGLSVRATRDLTDRLVDRGLLEVKGYPRGGRGRSTEYRVNVDVAGFSTAVNTENVDNSSNPAPRAGYSGERLQGGAENPAAHDTKRARKRRKTPPVTDATATSLADGAAAAAAHQPSTPQPLTASRAGARSNRSGPAPPSRGGSAALPEHPTPHPADEPGALSNAREHFSRIYAQLGVETSPGDKDGTPEKP